MVYRYVNETLVTVIPGDRVAATVAVAVLWWPPLRRLTEPGGQPALVTDVAPPGTRSVMPAMTKVAVPAAAGA